MQILQGGIKLKKFHLFSCFVLDKEMEELENLLKQTPILPNINIISWFDSVEKDYKQQKSLLETFLHTFPHAKVEGTGLLKFVSETQE
jgi:hypothetical protein